MEELLERGVYDMKELAEGGWLTALRYEDEVIADLKKRTGGKASKVRAVRRGSLLHVSSVCHACCTSCHAA